MSVTGEPFGKFLSYFEAILVLLRYYSSKLEVAKGPLCVMFFRIAKIPRAALCVGNQYHDYDEQA